MGNTSGLVLPSPLAFVTSLSMADVEEVLRRYRNAPPQAVLDSKTSPSFNASSTYLKTILTGVIEGVATGAVDMDSVFRCYRNGAMVVNDDDEVRGEGSKRMK